MSDGFLPSGQAGKSQKKGRRMRFSHRCLVDCPIQLESMDCCHAVKMMVIKSIISRWWHQFDGDQIPKFLMKFWKSENPSPNSHFSPCFIMISWYLFIIFHSSMAMGIPHLPHHHAALSLCHPPCTWLKHQCIGLREHKNRKTPKIERQNWWFPVKISPNKPIHCQIRLGDFVSGESLMIIWGETGRTVPMLGLLILVLGIMKMLLFAGKF